MKHHPVFIRDFFAKYSSEFTMPCVYGIFLVCQSGNGTGKGNVVIERWRRLGDLMLAPCHSALRRLHCTPPLSNSLTHDSGSPSLWLESLSNHFPINPDIIACPQSSGCPPARPWRHLPNALKMSSDIYDGADLGSKLRLGYVTKTSSPTFL